MTPSTTFPANPAAGLEPLQDPSPPQMPIAHATFVEAEATINGPRRGSYGDVHSSFGRVASMWSVILGKPTTSEEVALCMIALKLVREVNKPQHDNRVDIMGYAGLLAELCGGAK